MPEMYLRQPEFTSSACGKFTKKNKGRIQNIMDINVVILYKFLEKQLCFAHR